MSLELSTQLRLNGVVFGANTEDLTHEDTLRAPKPAGNCVGWILGHVLASRDGMLKALGHEPCLDEARTQRFRRGAAPLTDPAEAIPFDEVRAHFAAGQEKLLKSMAELTPERLAKPAPFSALGNEDETMGTLLASLLFHETYHLGQIGVVRRAIGKAGVLT